jgi:AcrR family transcriptional regulator
MGRRKTITDQQLLDAAREVFTAGGFGASTKSVARAAAISEGVLFQRFHTKEELFLAAMVPPPIDVNHIFTHPDAEGPALVRKVLFALTDYFRQTLPAFLPLLAHPSFRFEEFAARNPDTPLAVLRRELTQFTARLGSPSPGAAALLIWSVANTIAFFERLGAHGGKLPDPVIEDAVQTLWNGLRPAAKKPLSR